MCIILPVLLSRKCTGYSRFTGRKVSCVGSCGIQLGSHTYAHAGSSIDAPGCGIPWDPTGIPQDPAQ